MRLALLSNVTVDLLAGMLKSSADIYLSPGFDTWQQEMINTASGLYEYKPETVILLLHANAYTDIWNNIDAGCSMLDDWCNAIQILTTHLPSV